MKIKNAAILTLDGEPMREHRDPSQPPRDDAPVVTVAKILESVAISPPRNGKQHDEKANVERLLAAITCHRAKRDEEFELDSSVVAALKADVQGAYTPLVAGQVALLLEGKDTGIE